MSERLTPDWIARGDNAGIHSTFRRATPLRHDRLIQEFMPTAYESIRLSCVAPARYADVAFAKLAAGAMITLLDDLADRPDEHLPDLLRETAFVLTEPGRIDHNACPRSRRQWLASVIDLGRAVRHAVRRLPHGERLWAWMAYDFARCHLSMVYADIAGATPGAISATALAETQHQNMTVSLAGTIDLMASDHVDWREFGAMLAVFDEAQRALRVSNVLVTHARELREGDPTNELQARVDAGEPFATARAALEAERKARVAGIKSTRLGTFDSSQYASGLERVHNLHVQMDKVI